MPAASPTCPCLAGGSCVATAGPPGWTCTCPGGRTGARCELALEPCASAPCRNGGRCIGGSGWWACECTPGWTGDTCATRAPVCTPACPASATCVSDPPRCVCPPHPQRAARRCLERGFNINSSTMILTSSLFLRNNLFLTRITRKDNLNA